MLVKGATGGRGGISVKNTNSTDDVICARISNNMKLHTNNPEFGLELLAMIFISVQKYPARNQLLKGNIADSATEWGVTLVNDSSMTPIKLQYTTFLIVLMLD